MYTSELEKDFEEIYRQTTFLPGSTETMTKHSARLKIKLNAALWKHLKQTAPGSRLKEGASEPIIAALTAGGNLLAMTLRPIADDSIEWTNSGDKGLDMVRAMFLIDRVRMLHDNTVRLEICYRGTQGCRVRLISTVRSV